MKVSKVHIDHVVIYPHFEENDKNLNSIVLMIQEVLHKEALMRMMGIYDNTVD